MSAGRGGIVPPVEKRWQPGQSGNPAGRPAIGSSIREWINQLHNMTETEIRTIAQDQSAAIFKRAAADRWLQTLEVRDTATFQQAVKRMKGLANLIVADVYLSLSKIRETDRRQLLRQKRRKAIQLQRNRVRSRKKSLERRKRLWALDGMQADILLAERMKHEGD